MHAQMDRLGKKLIYSVFKENSVIINSFDLD